VNVPSALVRVVLVKFVPSFVIATSASATTAPETSVIVPFIVAVLESWAKAGMASKKTQNTGTRRPRARNRFKMAASQTSRLWSIDLFPPARGIEDLSLHLERNGLFVSG
jgi:hypothetical protein